MIYSAAGLALTKSFEGLRLTAYQDSGGVWTIGYGHTGPEVHAGQRITEAEAETLLRADLAAAICHVNSVVHGSLTQGQFDALVDFAYNCGEENLLHSTLLRCVDGEDFAGAAGQFGLWVHAAGQVLPGLVRRRAAEAAMFSGKEEG
jgi:lysozyme